MRPKILILLYVLLLMGWQAQAQKLKYAQYQGKEVPFKKVNQVIQDFKGYVWLGTDQGLFRFDGNSFEDFNTSLRSKTIRAFTFWDENSLLFSNDTGIHKIFYDGEVPRIMPFKTTEHLHYPTELFKDGQGRLWVGQLNGTIMLFSDTEFQGKVFEPIPNEKIPKIQFGEDKYGTIWVLLPEKGIFYLDPPGQKFLPFQNYESANNFLIADDTIWLVGDRLEKFTIGRDHTVKNRQVFAVDKKFEHIAQTNEGTLFLATESSVHTFREEGTRARLTKVFGANDPHRVEELSFGSINQLYFTTDETGHKDTIWVCSDNGLELMWTGFFQSVSGLGHDNVRGINSTQKGPILITQGNVSRIFDKSGTTGFKKEGNLNGIIGIASQEGTVWYGSAEGMLLQYQGTSLVKTYDLSKRGGGIFLVSTDHKGEVWFCQAASDKPIIGAAKIDRDGTLVEYGKNEGFESRILIIREGGKNELYAAGIGESTYLYRYDRSSDRFVNKSLPFPFKVSSNFEVHDMAVDHLGVVWMATTDGLIKYDTETVRRVDLGPLTLTEIRSICTMPDNKLWLATDTNGLIYLKEGGNYVVFDEQSGTPSKISAYRCMAHYNDARLWVGTAEGLVYSSLENPEPFETKPPTLKRIMVEGNEVDIKENIGLSESEILKLNMTTLTFPSDDVSYQFKVFESNLPVDEVDDMPWSETEKSMITFDALAGGNYNVQIRGQKAGGYKWSAPFKMNIRVSKKWYKTWWGLFIMAILGFTFFWYYARRWFLNRIGGLQATLRQKQRELREKEAELVSQSSALAKQKNELQSTGTNIYLLQRLIRQIPRDADWTIILPILGKFVEQPTGIDRFELAFKKGDDIKYKGYKRENGKLIERLEEFDEKKNLASYVIVTDKMVSIDDFDKEIGMYVNGKENDGYLSRTYIPFESRKGTTIVFCVYAKQKNAFSQRTNTLFDILVKFLSVNAKNQLN